jgi:hypothetical protein
MIELGDRWGAEDRSVFHVCAPGVRTPWVGDADACACGTLVPRRVRRFREWLMASERPNLGSLPDSLPDGEEPDFETG